MNVSGKGMVFRNTKDDRVWYNISDSSKDQEGNYVNKSWTVRFLKNQEPEERRQIKFEGFMTYYKANNGTVYTTIQVMKWQYVGTSSNGTTNSNNEQMTITPQYEHTNINIKDDDLPF